MTAESNDLSKVFGRDYDKIRDLAKAVEPIKEENARKKAADETLELKASEAVRVVSDKLQSIWSELPERQSIIDPQPDGTFIHIRKNGGTVLLNRTKSGEELTYGYWVDDPEMVGHELILFDERSGLPGIVYIYDAQRYLAGDYRHRPSGDAEGIFLGDNKRSYIDPAVEHSILDLKRVAPLTTYLLQKRAITNK